MNNLTLEEKLKKLVLSYAVSGYEWSMGITDTIQSLVGKKGQRIGDNLVYKFGTKGKKIFLSAHMDEVGFFISKVNKENIKIMPIGSIDIKSVVRKRLVFFINSVIVETNIVNKAKSFSDLVITGIDDPYVTAVGTFKKQITTRKGRVKGPGLDNKVGCLTLIQLIPSLEKIKDKTIYICFASREEQSTNGIMSAVRKIQPDICVDIDSAYAQPFNTPEVENWQIPKIGDGPAIQLMGKDFIVSEKFVQMLKKSADKSKSTYQFEIPDGENGSTNASTLISAGYETMQLNIPVANQHTSDSSASLQDICYTSSLLKELLEVI